MGAHSKQAVGLTIFLTAFIVFAGAFAAASVLLALVGLLLLAAAIFVFLRCKAFEQEA
jgi:hypothetical protein